MKKIARLDFFLINKNSFLGLVFNQPRCHGNSTHFSQNARIKSSVVKLYSCIKRAPKHEWFKSNGELGIGSVIGHFIRANYRQLDGQRWRIKAHHVV